MIWNQVVNIVGMVVSIVGIIRCLRCNSKLHQKNCVAVKKLYLHRILCGGNYVHTGKKKLDKFYLG